MAFPIPSHLPRRHESDVSTRLLSQMSDTTSKELTYDLAASWVVQLDEAIQQTKQQIHDRIYADLPAFDQQLASAKSIQERLYSLTTNVDKLDETISDPESGLVPTLIMRLSQHASLAQETIYSDVHHKTFSHLAQCRHDLEALSSLADTGRLSDAMRACHQFEDLLSHSPPPLERSVVMTDMKRCYRAVKNKAQEQLTDATSRSIVVSSSEIVITPLVQVRQSDAILPLSDILASLSTQSLTSHLNALRRDITLHYIDYLLKQPASVTVEASASALGSSLARLTIHLAPPNNEDRASCIENISTLLNFLNDHLFHHLPSGTNFPLSLCKPLTTAVLNNVLAPSLPSSLGLLPPFLDLVRKAVTFEEEFIDRLLGDKSPEKEIKLWADGVAAHYERRRRIDLLETARSIILKETNDSDSFRAEVIIESVVEKESTNGVSSDIASPVPIPEVEETAWGFDEEGGAVANDEWGFEDDVLPDSEKETVPEPEAESAAEDDPWGWNEDEDGIPGDPEETDSSAWDDPWGDTENITAPSAPKAASKLEKLSGKGKVNSGVALMSPIPTAAPPPTPAMPPPNSSSPALNKQPPSIQESYLVSGRTKELLFLVEDVLHEGLDLISSGVLPTENGPVGIVLNQTAGLILDLYRALFPVSFSAQLSQSAKQSIRFSNDCSWLSSEVERIALGDVSALAKAKLKECGDKLKVLSESWFADTVDNQCEKINEILDSAEGFTGTTEQDRYDECEDSVNETLQHIRRTSQQLKPVLNKTRYYSALGSIVDAALSRILRDVLALPDITEVESHKLNELCHILNALEGLFVEDPNQPSFVVAYVPSWLKFSYLSELLEASIADISYLFDEGALVDFEIDELIKLVKALFADTPLRTNTINKLMHGHPVHS
ncbi:hypothetical protein C8Q75DRAFT_714752 [Abortiporus biennis]|nr:hypothetical protein C8Q75DRAFT_714752 [Abortiporus biennis]